MTVFGQGDNPNTFAFSDGATLNQTYNSVVTINDVGRVTDINCYFGGDTAACTGGPVLYDGSNGNVLAYSAQAVSRGSHSSSGGFTITGSFDITFNSGQQYRCGAFRNSADSWVMPFNQSVGNYSNIFTHSGTSPAGAAGGTDWHSQFGFNGGFEGYGHYFPITTYIRRGAVWVKLASQLRRSSAWTKPKVYVRRSGGWTQLGMVAKDQELDWKKEIACIIEWAKGVWEKALLRWEYDDPKIFGKTSSGILLVSA
jgi:hypothetical protein